MLDYLMRIVRSDIGVEKGTSIASMVLVRGAMRQLQVELQDGGTEDGREDADENYYRVFRAITALNSRFDDIHLRRLRALQFADIAARITRIPTAAEVDASVESMREHEIDPDRHRDWMESEQPALLVLPDHIRDRPRDNVQG
jgi:hypothetical protein